MVWRNSPRIFLHRYTRLIVIEGILVVCLASHCYTHFGTSWAWRLKKAILSRSSSALTPSTSQFAVSSPWEAAWSSKYFFSSSFRAWDSSYCSTDSVIWNSVRSRSNLLSQLRWVTNSRSKSSWGLASFSSAFLLSTDKTSIRVCKSALALSSFRATCWLLKNSTVNTTFCKRRDLWWATWLPEDSRVWIYRKDLVVQHSLLVPRWERLELL